MKKIILIIIIAFFFLIPGKVSAQEYVVKPVILIPDNWKDRITNDQINLYKKLIVDGLVDVQNIYARELGGKKFAFTQVEVIYSPKVSEESIESVAFELAQGSALMPKVNGLIRAVWVVGTSLTDGQDLALGGSNGGTSGFALFSFADLIARSRGNLDWPQKSLAHELGHAFGLNYTGYSDAHPCSVVSESECIKGAPKPYPERIEWDGIMGSRGMMTHFNNSIHNPEKKKLYQSPFMYPHGGTPPEPIDSPSGEPQLKTQQLQFSPNQLIAGETLTITGSDFGTIAGTIKFLSPFPDNQPLKENLYEILEWSNNKITVQFKENAVVEDARMKWIVEVRSTSIIKSTNEIEILGKNYDTSVTTIKVDFQLTCGQEKNPLPDFPLRLAGTNNVTLTEARSDSNGKGKLMYQVPSEEKDRGFYVFVPPIPGLTTNLRKSNTFTVAQEELQFDFTYNDNLPQCPSFSFTPTSIEGAETVTISGSGFGFSSGEVTLIFSATSDKAEVFINSGRGITINSWSESEIKFHISSYAGLDNRSQAKIIVTPDWLNKISIPGEITILNPSYNRSEPTPSPTPPEQEQMTPTPTTEEQIEEERQQQKKDEYERRGSDGDLEPTPTPTPPEQEQAVPPTPASEEQTQERQQQREEEYERTGGSEGNSESTAETQPQLIQIQISNFDDFRSDNPPGDEGSNTKIISPGYQQIPWTTSTVTQERRVYVRELYSDQNTKIQIFYASNGETIYTSDIEILTRVIKKVVGVKVNGQAFDIGNPNSELSFRLPGTEGVPGWFDLPVEITYSDGHVSYFAFNLNYQPPVAVGGTTNDTTNDTINDTLSCPNWQHIRNECTGCGLSRRIEEDACQPGTTRIAATDQGDEACLVLDWCKTPTPVSQNDTLSCPFWTHLRNECTSCGLANRVEEDRCTGNLMVTQRDYREYACDNYPCRPEEQVEERQRQREEEYERRGPTPLPETDSCSWYSYENVCVSCGKARPLEKNSCTDKTRLQNYEVNSNNCNSVYLCDQDKICGAPYPQAGGTAGLESFPSNHTIWIIPGCNNFGAREYSNDQKIDLGQLE